MSRHSYVGVDLARATREGFSRVQQRLGTWARAHDVALESIPRRLLALPLADLGDTPAPTLEAAALVLTRVAQAFGPITLGPEMVEAWPTLQAPRLLHLRLADPDGRLAAMQRAVRDGLADYGFALDPREWVPHIPLARVPHGSPSLPPLSVEALALRIDTLGIYTRVPTADGRMAWSTHSLHAVGADAPEGDAEADESAHRAALRQQLDERLAARAEQARARPPRRRRRRRPTDEKDDE